MVAGMIGDFRQKTLHQYISDLKYKHNPIPLKIAEFKKTTSVETSKNTILKYNYQFIVSTARRSEGVYSLELTLQYLIEQEFGIAHIE